MMKVVTGQKPLQQVGYWVIVPANAMVPFLAIFRIVPFLQQISHVVAELCRRFCLRWTQ